MRTLLASVAAVAGLTAAAAPWTLDDMPPTNTVYTSQEVDAAVAAATAYAAAGLSNKVDSTDDRLSDAREPLPHVHDVRTDFVNLPMQGAILSVGEKESIVAATFPQDAILKGNGKGDEITAAKAGLDYVAPEDPRLAAVATIGPAATNYTDAAIAAIEIPDTSLAPATNYTDSVAAELRAAIAAAEPGDYATVSNRAMSAVQTESDPVFATWLGADPLATYAPTGHVHASVVAGDTTLAAVSGGTASVIREKPGCLRFEQSSFVASFHDTAAEIGSWTLPTIELDVVYDGVAYSALGTLEELGEDEFAYSLASGLSWLDGAHFETYDSYTVFYDLGDGAPARHLGDGTGETLSTYTWRHVSTLATVSDLAAVSNALDAVVATIGPAATNYTDSAKTIALAYASAVSNMLDAAIRAAEPGDYAAVSNRAMSAIQTELDPLYAEWTRTNQIATALAGKQATIPDLATIRAGAAAGATAVQDVLAEPLPSGVPSGNNIGGWISMADMFIGSLPSGESILTATADGGNITRGYNGQNFTSLSINGSPIVTSDDPRLSGGADLTEVSNIVNQAITQLLAEAPDSVALAAQKAIIADLWQRVDSVRGADGSGTITAAEAESIVNARVAPLEAMVAQWSVTSWMMPVQTTNRVQIALGTTDRNIAPELSPLVSTEYSATGGSSGLTISAVSGVGNNPCWLIIKSGFSSASFPSGSKVSGGSYQAGSDNYFRVSRVSDALLFERISP